MGNVQYRAPPPPGATVFVIESDECCTCTPCGSRNWDPMMRQPTFVAMSSNAWQDFVTTMGGHVRRYRAEARSVPIMILCIVLGMVLFHPVIGVVGNRMTFGAEGRRLQTSGVNPEYCPVNPDERCSALHDRLWDHYGRACRRGCMYAEVTAGIFNASSIGSAVRPTGCGVQVSGVECANGYGTSPSDQNYLINQLYTAAGSTASGAPYYCGVDRPEICLFHDASCSDGSEPSCRTFSNA